MLEKKFYPQNFGLIKNNLYEVLATTFSKEGENGEIHPNTSCMGIRLIENNLITIVPFSNTTTYKNLIESGMITLNFVMDVELYALAALKEHIPSKELSHDSYDYKELNDPFNESSETKKILIPYMNEAWAALICILAGENEIVKQDFSGEIKISEFKLYIISFELIQRSFKLFNRAENLALETIILATRLKVAHEKGEQVLTKKIQDKISDYMKDIKRFGKNENAFKAIELVSIYVKNVLD